jgi:hypothetical protein
MYVSNLKCGGGNKSCLAMLTTNNVLDSHPRVKVLFLFLRPT